MITAPTGTSTYVTAQMNVNGLTIPVAQMCPDFVILRDTPPRIAPCDAEIVMEVDGVPTHFAIHLPSGISPEMKRIPIAEAA